MVGCCDLDSFVSEYASLTDVINTVFQLIKKVPAFYGTRWFITSIAHHLSLS